MTPKLVSDVPDPPPVTPEVVAEMRREAEEWGKLLRAKARAIEDVGPKDSLLSKLTK